MSWFGMRIRSRTPRSNFICVEGQAFENFYRLITEKFKEMEKTYKAQIQQEQTAKASKTTVKGSASLLESSMRTSPLQSMV
jgi:phage regulator Rha-like protein